MTMYHVLFVLGFGGGTGKIKSSGTSCTLVRLISEKDGCAAAFNRPRSAKNNKQA